MKKSTLIMILSLVLAVALGVGGTLAYLTDTDADVNVMVMGDVQIVQNEQQRIEQGNAEAGLEEFEQYKSLLPYVTIGNTTKENVTVGDYTIKMRDNVKNYVDKIVTVTNIGNNDAFVRTIIAVPTGEINYTPATQSDNWLHWNYVSDTDTTPNNGWYYGQNEGLDLNATGNENGVPTGIEEWEGRMDQVNGVEINGVEYDLFIFTNKNVIAPGETTGPNMVGLYLDSRVDKDENGYFIRLTPNDDKHYIAIEDPSNVQILVASQAVQADGFEEAGAWYALDAAFGDITADNHPWSNGMPEVGSPDGDKNDTNNPPILVGDDDEVTFDVPADAYRVTNTAELEAAVAAGETTILLADGEYNANMNATTGKNLKLYGESKNAVLKSTKEGDEGADYDFDGSTVTFNGLTLDTSSHSSSFKGYARMNGTYNDCVIIGEYCLYGDAEFNYCTLNTSGDIYNIRTWGAPVATFDHCTFNSDGKAMLLYGTANTKLTLESCLFNDTGVLPDLKAAVEIGDDYGKSYELIVNNTVVNGYEENDKGIPTGTTLWGNKNSMSSDKLNVVVDGVDIY